MGRSLIAGLAISHLGQRFSVIVQRSGTASISSFFLSFSFRRQWRLLSGLTAMGALG
jgi:hypothetical protein